MTTSSKHSFVETHTIDRRKNATTPSTPRSRVRRDAVVFTEGHEAPALDEPRKHQTPAPRRLLPSGQSGRQRMPDAGARGSSLAGVSYVPSETLASVERSSQQVRAPRVGPLLRFVQLSSERRRQAVRQHCSFAKKQESPPALLRVVRSGRVPLARRHARIHPTAEAWPRAARAASGVTVLPLGAQWSALGLGLRCPRRPARRASSLPWPRVRPPGGWSGESRAAPDQTAACCCTPRVVSST